MRQKDVVVVKMGEEGVGSRLREILERNRITVDIRMGSSEEDIPFFAEVTAGGRITIPEEIRKIFEIKDGDGLMCRIRVVRRKVQQTEQKG
jgi:hypothetical protein